MKPLSEMTEIEKSKLLLNVIGWEEACDKQNLYTTDRHVFMKIMQSLLNGDTPLARRYQDYVRSKFTRLGGDFNDLTTMVYTKDVIQDVVLGFAIEFGLVGTPITRDELIKAGFDEGERFFTKICTKPYSEVSVVIFNDSYGVYADSNENIISFPGCKTMAQLKSLWEMLSDDTN